MSGTEPINEEPVAEQQTSEPVNEPVQDATATEEKTEEITTNSAPYNLDERWHVLSVEDCLARVQLEDTVEGVANEDVERRGKELGNNFVPTDTGKNPILMLLGHFCNSITIILAVVAGVSVWLKDWGEFGVVLFVILFNGLLGFWQEYSAEKSIQGLKNLSEGSAKVIRSGQIAVIPVSECVIGDIVVLEQGATVPTDVRLFEVNNLQLDEALLTGEGVPQSKIIEPVDDPDVKAQPGDWKNMAFRFSTVVNGRGRGITVNAGTNTEVGKIAGRLTSGDDTGGKSPLQIKMERLMWILFACCAVLIIVVFGANQWDFGNGPTILYAAAVAIAILPESLIAVITVAMTISVRRMAQDKCIVRKLAALEELGNVTDICSDKTGTLTENKMVAQAVVIGLDRVIDITGEPLDPHAVFIEDGKQVVPSQLFESPDFAEYMTCAALCSSTHVYLNDGKLSFKGNPTEVAVQSLCWKAERSRQHLEENGWNRRGEWSFDSVVKTMSSGYLHEGKSHIYAKGAPDRVLAKCTHRLDKNGTPVEITDDDKTAIEEHLEALGGRGLRCICLTRKLEDCGMDLEDKLLSDFERPDVENELVYLGLVGILDPPRPSSGPSVRLCQRAGIKVRMLTGDHTSTATAISKSLGIVTGNLAPDTDVMLGADFDAMKQEDRLAMKHFPSVIGRCSPMSKVNMVEALQANGRIVAMTGDGFNDAPSIKAANVGCAMGSGTDVTKGVAELVITDDKFTTIVKAVSEGRRISNSISKFVVHLLSGNVAEVIVLILGLGVQLDKRSVFILSPIEILWLNMFTGSPPATGLSLDEADPDILIVPPNTKGFFTPELIADTFIYGFFLGATALSSFLVVLYGFADGPVGQDCNKPKAVGCEDIWTARSTCFSVLYLGLLFHAYNVRNTRKSIIYQKWFDNNWLWGSVAFGIITLIPILYAPPIAKYVFVHDPLTWEWGVVAVALLVFLILCEIYKVIKNTVFPLEKVTVPPSVAEITPEDEEMTASLTHRQGTLQEIAIADVKDSIRRQGDHTSADPGDSIPDGTVNFNRTGSFVMNTSLARQGSFTGFVSDKK